MSFFKTEHKHVRLTPTSIPEPLKKTFGPLLKTFREEQDDSARAQIAVEINLKWTQLLKNSPKGSSITPDDFAAMVQHVLAKYPASSNHSLTSAIAGPYLQHGRSPNSLTAKDVTRAIIKACQQSPEVHRSLQKNSRIGTPAFPAGLKLVGLFLENKYVPSEQPREEGTTRKGISFFSRSSSNHTTSKTIINPADISPTGSKGKETGAGAESEISTSTAFHSTISGG